MYKEFLRVVSIVQPKIVLMENVKEIVTYKNLDGTRILNDIQNSLNDFGYRWSYEIVNSRYYGVPQERKRFFLLAVREDISDAWFTLEYLLERYKSQEISFFEATSDLPEVYPLQYSEDAILSYNNLPKNDFQKRMRKDNIEIHNHISMQHSKKAIEKFKFLQSNIDKELPDHLKPIARGSENAVSSSIYSQNYRVIDGNKVSPTITASFYSSFVHPKQPRNLTVREAARLQTFPDTFVFMGKKTTLSKSLLAKKGIYEEMHLDQFNQVRQLCPPSLQNILQMFAKISYTKTRKSPVLSFILERTGDFLFSMR